MHFGLHAQTRELVIVFYPSWPTAACESYSSACLLLGLAWDSELGIELLEKPCAVGVVVPARKEVAIKKISPGGTRLSLTLYIPKPETPHGTPCFLCVFARA